MLALALDILFVQPHQVHQFGDAQIELKDGNAPTLSCTSKEVK
jgi:hypothetical protein